MIRSKRILVVGSEGFIGTNYCRDRDVDRFDLLLGDDARRKIPSNYDYIVFLACDMRDTHKAWDNNWNMVNRLPESNIIYISSAAVYGEYESPRVERDICKPISWYGKAKKYGERVDFAVLRLANVYGPGGHGVINRFRNGENIIHGDGKQIRDFVPVQTVCECIDAAIDNFDKWVGVTNVSSGKGRTINEIWEDYGIGKPKYVKACDEVRYSVLDNSKMLEQL